MSEWGDMFALFTSNSLECEIRAGLTRVYNTRHIKTPPKNTPL